MANLEIARRDVATDEQAAAQTLAMPVEGMVRTGQGGALAIDLLLKTVAHASATQHSGHSATLWIMPRWP